MKTSHKGIELIKQHEGLRLQAYKCPGGVWTIGYGHTKDVSSGMSIDRTTADELLKDDLRTCEDCLNSLNLSVNQNQFDALVSFIFNVGIGNFKKSTLLLKVRINPDDNSIMDEFLKWVYSRGKVLPGLQRRRLAEVKLYYSNL